MKWIWLQEHRSEWKESWHEGVPLSPAGAPVAKATS
jgi:hypothetical protein